ncbi:MAG: HAD hydrolase-like protein [Bdellovibrionia bacterium]
MIRAIAFDLDDTLLDTSGILVPKAAERACLALMSVGASCSLEECLNMRKELAASASHPEIFGHIADHFEVQERDLAIQLAIQEFYNPEVPNTLPLIAGAREVLQQLLSKYDLYLVTMGMKSAQAQKIAALNIAPFFKRIFILDSIRGERKLDAFQEILRHSNYLPEELLCVGNRLSAEIRDGKLCGAKTCYFEFGEHVGEKPQMVADIPDFTIRTHYELIETCKL